jgi:hypothetical protein
MTAEVVIFIIATLLYRISKMTLVSCARQYVQANGILLPVAAHPCDRFAFSWDNQMKGEVGIAVFSPCAKGEQLH